MYVKLPEKMKLFENLPGKIEIFLIQIHDLQISNQIDAADWVGIQDDLKFQ